MKSIDHNIDGLIDHLTKILSELESLDGNVIDDSLKRKYNFKSGPTLHQDTDDDTEEENAQFELDHPAESLVLQSITEKVIKSIEEA